MGKITKIEVQKKNKDRVNIYIDDKYAFAAFVDVVINQGIKKGMELDADILQKIDFEEHRRKCKNAAIKIVERSAKTEKQVIDKLKEKEYSDDAIKYAVDFLNEYGFINDRLYAKSFAHDKLMKNGTNKIKFELRRKGISDDIIKETLNDINDDEEIENAVSIAEKKYVQILRRESDKYKIKNKLYTFLAGRGYSFDTVKKVVEIVMKEY